MDKSIAIDIQNSSNIFIGNLRVNGFDVAVNSKDVENLTIRNTTISNCNNGFIMANSKRTSIDNVDFLSNSRYSFVDGSGRQLKAIAVFLDVILNGKVD